MLNPGHLKTLLVILRTGSFVDAARELDYTASAVSQQMSALERTVGMKLFEREAHSVRPTMAAEMLGIGARDVLTSILQLEEEAMALAHGERGRVRVGSFPSAGATLMPRAIQALSADSPGVEVLLDEGEPEVLLDHLLEGDLDVLLAYEYSVVPRTWPEGLSREQVLREDLILLVPADPNLPTGVEHADLSALADAHWVASGVATGGAACLERLCAAVGFSPQVAFRSNNYDTVIGIVGANLGVALVPALAYRGSPLVRARSLDPELASRRVYAIWREGNTNPLIPMVVSSVRRAAVHVEFAC
ncbi:MAG TPA: LysR family transcriptional regulator [Acidimicrobiales bacterium]|nr:LysR family transcriptional regulator [Acidimicrobiales bacterium]